MYSVYNILHYWLSQQIYEATDILTLQWVLKVSSLSEIS